MKPIYVAAGFSNDMKTLFNQFFVLESVRFGDFTDCFRAANFKLIFTGRYDEREMREFIDEIFLITLKKLDDEERPVGKIAALYLLYCLYVAQPVTPRQQIRCKMSTFLVLRDLIQVCRDKGHLDAAYIWFKLLSMGAFYFVARDRLQGPAWIINHKLLTSELVADPTPSTSSNENLEQTIRSQLSELKNIHDNYQRMKQVLLNEQQLPPIDVASERIFDLNFIYNRDSVE